jgi:hypothetical protein
VIDTDRRLLLAARRARLVQRAAQQRQQLGATVAPLRPAWQVFEFGLRVGRSLRQRPWLLALPVAAAVMWRRRSVGGGLALVPLLWRLWSLWPRRL